MVSKRSEDELYEINMSFPLPSEREAQICYDVLRVDDEPPRSKVTKNLKYIKNKFYVKLSSSDLRQLRVSLTSFMDHLRLVISSIHEFGPPVSNHYDFYKGSGTV